MRKLFLIFFLFLFVFGAFSTTGCSPRINLLPNYDTPLQEVTLSGSGESKVLVIPISGIIDDHPKRGFILSRPSLVEEVVATLEQAEKDSSIKAVVLRIDSPGGTVTASDILFREIERFKQKSGVKVVSLMMGVAASGGYMTALAGDEIIAHPTAITGSIGVVLFTVNFQGLMDKIGVEAESIKSGKHKDMGSPHREMSNKEIQIMQVMVDEFYEDFINLVAEKRKDLSIARVRTLSDGRIYTAKQAADHKLIDSTGYTRDAISRAKVLAGISESSKVVVYRRNTKANDTLYNPEVSASTTSPSLVDFGLDSFILAPRSGFYYIWEPGLSTAK